VQCLLESSVVIALLCYSSDANFLAACSLCCYAGACPSSASQLCIASVVDECLSEEKILIQTYLCGAYAGDPCMLSKSSPELAADPRHSLAASSPVAHLPLPLSTNPNLHGCLTPRSPVSNGASSSQHVRSMTCVPQAGEHVRSVTLHRRSSLPRLQTTADAPPSVHAPTPTHLPHTYASMSHAAPARSPSMLSLAGAGASVNGGGSTVSGFWGAGDTTGRPHSDSASMRLSKPKPTLAKAGQFGPVSKGQGGSVGRLDFQLQEDFAEWQWVGAFKAHFCYWKHDDVALFICRAACGYDVVDGRKEEQAEEDGHTSPAH
jgi:hypothetical protein